MIQPVRQDRYSMNISQFYIQHWKLVHALRQAFANWQDAIREKYPHQRLKLEHSVNALGIHHFHMHIDGVKSEINFIKYDSYERRLILTNEGFFRVHNMLMGASSRAANQENPDNAYLGQFGEGMKLFMLLILTNNLTCFIESGSNYYGPELSQWKFEYVGGRVLHVNIRPRTQPQQNTVVTIDRVTEEMFLNFRYLSLSMVSDYQVVEHPRMRLILSTNPSLQGKIFKKGILIAMRYSIDSKFSYDLDDIVLGRDRDSINDYEQLKHLQSKLHALILNDHEQLYETRADIRDLLDSHVEDCIRGLKVNSFRTWYLYSYANASSFNRIYRKFLVQHDRNELYPTYNGSHITQINNSLSQYGLPKEFYPHVGTRTISCNLTVNHIFCQHHSKAIWSWLHGVCLMRSLQFYRSCPIKVQTYLLSLVPRPLNDQQANKLQPILNSINGLGVATLNLTNYAFRIKDFDVTVCYKDVPNHTIFFSNARINELPNNRDAFLVAMLKMLIN